ncbi:MAG: ATP synthase F0 subunit B [Oscillospiraceae bacterium]|jgi:F-type H+-transporting ATPase subunit b|nr:ATP synthase F0 subunit B [Oscillospiraceae bacterium]
MLPELHWENILLHIVNMAVLFVIVRFLVYKPVRRFMDKRSARIAASLEEARRAREEAEALRKEGELKIAQAEEGARAKALEITQAANESARAMAESARAEGRAMVEKAQAEIKEEHDRAMEGLRGDVIDLATEIAAQILRENYSTQDTLHAAEAYFAGRNGGDAA